MKKPAVGIIDYVGIKAGMHYYSLGLLEALNKQSFETYYCSNYRAQQSQYKTAIKLCFDANIKKSFQGLLNLVSGLFFAIHFFKKKKVKVVIHHLFEVNTMVWCILSLYKLFGFKVWAIVHDIESFEKDNSNRIEKRVYQTVIDHLIVHNEFSKKALLQKVDQDLKNKLSIIPHGNYQNQINNQLSKAEARGKLNLANDTFYVLFFGQIKNVKGLDLLLKAIPKIDKVELLIAGKVWKDDFSIYQSIIEKRGIENQTKLWIRHISDEEKDYFFAAADLLVLPYKKIYQSGVLLMSLSYGLPALVSDLPANRETAANAAIYFTSENVSDLNSKLKSILDQTQQLHELRDKSKARAQDFEWNHISSLYEKLLLTVI